jgi:hypothetical protein
MKGMVILLGALVGWCRAVSQDIIVWDSATKLTWVDFRGKVDAKSAFDAATVSGIRYRLSLGGEGLSDTVTAVFYTAESWVRRGTGGSLIHEQGHFDITEIFARKLRKRIREFVPRRGDLAHQLNLLYEEVERDREAMERLYDEETRHSTDVARQAEWNGRIRAALKELGAFAD